MIHFMVFNIMIDGTASMIPSWTIAPLELKGIKYNLPQITADVIKESEDDTFIFIIPEHSYGTIWRKWIEDYGLADYIVYESPGITNPNHPDRPNNLVLYVLASKEHIWRDMFEVDYMEHVNAD